MLSLDFLKVMDPDVWRGQEKRAWATSVVIRQENK